MSYHAHAWFRLTAACWLLAAGCGCSIKNMAINKLGNALASSGSTFESDEDPELVAAAIPFGLKLYEGLLAESPKHTGLLLAACSGFTEYAYAFVDMKAEEAKEESLDSADALRERARKLYLRANRYGMRGLESKYPGFGAGSITTPPRRSSAFANRTCRCSIGRRRRWAWRSPVPRATPR